MKKHNTSKDIIEKTKEKSKKRNEIWNDFEEEKEQAGKLIGFSKEHTEMIYKKSEMDKQIMEEYRNGFRCGELLLFPRMNSYIDSPYFQKKYSVLSKEHMSFDEDKVKKLKLELEKASNKYMERMDKLDF